MAGQSPNGIASTSAKSAPRTSHWPPALVATGMALLVTSILASCGAASTAPSSGAHSSASKSSRSQTSGGSAHMVWSKPARIAGPLVANFGAVHAVSCASSSFCVAVDNQGNALIYNGTRWSSPQGVDSGAVTGAGDLLSVSCPTSNFCVAVDPGPAAVVYKSGHWALPRDIGSPSSPYSQYGYSWMSVSCASSQFCVTTLLHGVGTYNGKSWSTAPLEGRDETLTNVSCPSVGFCVGVTGSVMAGLPFGQFVILSGGTWSPPQYVGGTSSNELSVVSCASASYCVGLLGNESVTYNGSQWSKPVAIQPGVSSSDWVSLSCSSQHFCVAVEAGLAATYNGRTWSAPTVIDGAAGGGRDPVVSCSAGGFCMVIEDQGLGGEAAVVGHLG